MPIRILDTLLGGLLNLNEIRRRHEALSKSVDHVDFQSPEIPGHVSEECLRHEYEASLKRALKPRAEAETLISSSVGTGVATLSSLIPAFYSPLPNWIRVVSGCAVLIGIIYFLFAVGLALELKKPKETFVFPATAAETYPGAHERRAMYRACIKLNNSLYGYMVEMAATVHRLRLRGWASVIIGLATFSGFMSTSH